jgi:hypothetical protein
MSVVFYAFLLCNRKANILNKRLQARIYVRNLVLRADASFPGASKAENECVVSINLLALAQNRRAQMPATVSTCFFAGPRGKERPHGPENVALDTLTAFDCRVLFFIGLFFLLLSLPL